MTPLHPIADKREARPDAVSRAIEIAAASWDGIRTAGGLFWSELDDTTKTLAIVSARNALATAEQQRISEGVRAKALEQAAREAVALIDEFNERSESRKFWGIDQGLHAKVATVRATLARALMSSPVAPDEESTGITLEEIG